MYNNQLAWERLQEYLPIQHRLTNNTIPNEKVYEFLNYKIHIDEYIPASKSNVSIVILHGVGGNGRLLSFLAVPLYKKGYEVVCPDLPGYGYSQYSKYPTYDDWVDVGCEVVRKKLQEGKQVILMGLSAGGMLAYNVACKVPEVDGLIVTNILDNRLEVVRQYSAKNSFQAKYGLKLLKLMPDFIKEIKVPIGLVTNMRGLVNNKEVLKILLKDKKGAGNSVELKFLLSMMDSVPVKEPEEFTEMPVLLCHPENDKWTPTSISEMFFDRIQSDKKKVILENCGHFPIEAPGRATLQKEIEEFISETTS